MKIHFEGKNQPLHDEDIVSWSIDPGLIFRPGGGFENEDPITLATVGSLPNRPDTGSAIPNFILAGDYVRAEWEMGNMEVANESGRRAANEILARSGSHESPVRIFGTYRPPEWEPLKRIDEQLYRNKQPNLFDGLTSPVAMTTARRMLPT
jgi:hypothetical protein